MSKSLETIIKHIISKEGGYVNHPNDIGGPTNMGVTQRTLSDYLGRPASIEEVKNLTYDQAEEIYLRRYVIGPRIDTLPTLIQPILADTAVLFGPRKAIYFCQKIVNEAGFGPIDTDGICGPNTRNAISKAVQEMGKFFINAIVEERIAYHEMRCEKVPSQRVFLRGWINRAESFREDV